MTTAATVAGCSPLDAVQRRLRLPVFTAATVTLGVGVHTASGGAPPRADVLALIAAVVALVWRSAAEDERQLPTLLGAVLLTQLGIHVALLGHHGAGQGPDPARMTTLHAVAAVLLACWLRRGEAAAWRITVGVLRRILTPVATSPVPAQATGAGLRVADRTAPPDPSHVGPVRPVRGPPCPA